MPKSFVGFDLNMFYAFNVKKVPDWGPRLTGVALFGIALKQYAQPLTAGQFNVYLGLGTDFFFLPYASFGADFFHENGKSYLGVAVTGRFMFGLVPVPLLSAGLLL